MRFHFSSFGKKRVKRFFKRSHMDSSTEWDLGIQSFENNEANLQDFIYSARNIIN